MVCNYADHSNNYEVCRWLGAVTRNTSNHFGVYRWENSRRVVVRTIYPKIIRGYKAAPHKIVRNIDGEWTDTDLHYLSQCFSKEAVEAMKEEVKDNAY